MRRKVLNMELRVGRGVSFLVTPGGCTRSAGPGCAAAALVGCDPRSQSNGSKTFSPA